MASASNCQRDIPYLQQLQTNAIRVYALDPTKNHDDCMNMLADAGIYVIADLSAPGASIDRSDPSWNTQLYSRYTAVVDSMAKYTNTLGFFAGNEVANNASYTESAAFVKAAVRDMKSYIKAKNYRTIGVGYANNDDPETRVNLADYFNCGDPSTSVDFWGYNVYSWCGDSTYQQSGYADRVAQFANYDVPVFFAEYGCNTQGTRTFQEVGTIYSSPMDQVWSGGIVYMYFQEANDYGKWELFDYFPTHANRLQAWSAFLETLSASSLISTTSQARLLRSARLVSMPALTRRTTAPRVARRKILLGLSLLPTFHPHPTPNFAIACSVRCHASRTTASTTTTLVNSSASSAVFLRLLVQVLRPTLPLVTMVSSACAPLNNKLVGH